MTGQFTLNIRYDRSSGSTQLVRTIDDVDLPWLMQLVEDLRAEDDALLTLVDDVHDDRVQIRIHQGRYQVERLRQGAASDLRRDAPDDGDEIGGDQPDGDQPESDGTAGGDQPDHRKVAGGRAGLDPADARAAVESVLRDRPLAPGLRWA